MPDEGVFAVADGMGGASAGEVASAMLCKSLQNMLSNSGEDLPGLRKYNTQQAIRNANDAVQAYVKAHGYAQMGTTLVLFLVDSWKPGKALICHIGDSRAYRLRGKELERLTADHNAGAQMEPRWRLFARKQSEAEERAARLLTRAVGISSQTYPEWHEHELLPGDVYLLCTDGLTTMMDDKAIRDVLLGANDPEEVVARLSQGILAAGAQDNFTLCCLEVSSEFPPAIEADEADREESDNLMKLAEWRRDNA